MDETATVKVELPTAVDAEREAIITRDAAARAFDDGSPGFEGAGGAGADRRDVGGRCAVARGRVVLRRHERARLMARPVSSANVISAVYHLQRQEGPRKIWPTVEQIAKYLAADVGDVQERLRELKARRLFRDRQRNRVRVWMPWDEA